MKVEVFMKTAAIIRFQQRCNHANTVFLTVNLTSYPNFHPTYNDTCRIRKLIEILDLHENFMETLEDTALMIQTLRYLSSILMI